MSTRRLAAIMFADIAGYTAMMQSDEQKGLELVQRFKTTMEKYVPLHHGEILQFMGDGSLCIFQSAVEATQAAMDIQKELQQDPIVPLRIGLHIGDIVIQEDSIYGDGVNIASRVESMGVAGAILLSENVRNQIKNKPKFELVSLGKFSFKNVKEDMNVYALANEGLKVPKAKEMQGKGNLAKEPQNKDARLLVRSALIGFIGLVVGIGIWLGISWKGSNQAPAPIPSVAVMPFTDMSSGSNQGYLGDGMAEEIINLLTQLPSLKVTSRSSSFSFRNQNVDLFTISEKLGVEHILEGSIRDNGKTLKISVQLIEAKTDQAIWSNTWESKIDDVFIIQESIAKEVVQRLKVNLLDNQRLASEKQNLDAYRLYLQSRYELSQGKFRKARELITQSILLDSLYAPSWATLGLIDNHYAGLGNSPTGLRTYPELHALAKRNAKRGVSLGPDIGMPHAVLGLIYQFTLGKADSGQFHLNKAIALAPGDASTLMTIGIGKTFNGEFSSALTYLNKAEALDPLSSEIYVYEGMTYLLSHKFPQAEENFRKALQLNPKAGFANGMLAQSLLEQGKLEEAKVYAAKERFSGIRVAIQAIIAWEKGDITASDTYLNAFVKRNSGPTASSSYQIAQVYAYRNEIDAAFEWLERSIEQYDPGMHWAPTDNLLENLHDDPRWEPFVAKIR